MMKSSSKQLLIARLPRWPKLLTVTVCSISAVLFLLRWISSRRAQKKIVKAKSQRDKSVQMTEKAFEQFKEKHPEIDVDAILALPLPELTKKLKDGLLSPYVVLHTYMGKAVKVNSRLNCVTEFLLESREQLSQLETDRAGLLYGVPVSIKDNLGYKGHDSTCGVLLRLGQPVSEDSVLVRVLKRQGAIPFVKTNVPQGLLNYDCSNPIFGQTLNPTNPRKTAGGSSGGEAALIGGGGSILGFGTDIGGSIRIPSAFGGICGFKPTSNRLSLRGSSSCCRGQKSVLTSLGPMARDVDSLALCMKALLCEEMFSLDPTVPPIPFNEQEYLSSKPLRIGFYVNDGYQMPSPSMARALHKTKNLLERAGHTGIRRLIDRTVTSICPFPLKLVPFTPPKIAHTMSELIVKGILADSGTTLLGNLKEGPTDPCLQTQTLSYSLPHVVKKILACLLKPLYPRMAASVNALCGVSSIPDLWKQHTEVEEYIHEFIGEWRKLDLDALLCPMLGPAYNLGYCGKLTSALSYTVLYNLLNFPVGVVPVSTVTEADEEELKHYKGNFGDFWDKLFKKAVTGGQDLPVAVQCVTLPWQDERCLRFMREVEGLVRDSRN